MADECEDFFKRHRGGSGAVVAVEVYKGDRDAPWRSGIFGSIETARQWMGALPDDCTSIVIPYIVDDPDWGNEADTQKRVGRKR